MKVEDMHTTNYRDTLIQPAEDCRAECATVPNKQGSVALMQYERVIETPYVLQSDDLLCSVAALRKDIPDDEYGLFRNEFFSKGQACLRASPLVKTFGWAIHHDSDARIALIDPASAQFEDLCKNSAIKVVKGMRNKRA